MLLRRAVAYSLRKGYRTIIAAITPYLNVVTTTFLVMPSLHRYFKTYRVDAGLYYCEVEGLHQTRCQIYPGAVR